MCIRDSTTTSLYNLTLSNIFRPSLAMQVYSSVDSFTDKLRNLNGELKHFQTWEYETRLLVDRKMGSSPKSYVYCSFMRSNMSTVTLKVEANDAMIHTAGAIDSLLGDALAKDSSLVNGKLETNSKNLHFLTKNPLDVFVAGLQNVYSQFFKLFDSHIQSSGYLEREELTLYILAGSIGFIHVLLVFMDRSMQHSSNQIVKHFISDTKSQKTKILDKCQDFFDYHFKQRMNKANEDSLLVGGDHVEEAAEGETQANIKPVAMTPSHQTKPGSFHDLEGIKSSKVSGGSKGFTANVIAAALGMNANSGQKFIRSAKRTFSITQDKRNLSPLFNRRGDGDRERGSYTPNAKDEIAPLVADTEKSPRKSARSPRIEKTKAKGKGVKGKIVAEENGKDKGKSVMLRKRAENNLKINKGSIVINVAYLAVLGGLLVANYFTQRSFVEENRRVYYLYDLMAERKINLNLVVAYSLASIANDRPPLIGRECTFTIQEKPPTCIRQAFRRAISTSKESTMITRGYRRQLIQIRPCS
eukprot:TRINITY_DN5303_c0_g1_i8.p1 TRINITY_DN5303_c0_g1~~TRINITY_DN5303_c0_g1_i8.p1  ORF type:complete len:528 (-),score=62.46 TRINITY_DN5303_c0_g1_i8:773-2356(-)